MKEKARFYLGFFICTNVQAKRFSLARYFLSYIGASGGTRINTGFSFTRSFPSLKPPSAWGTQVANAALGRRGWLRR